MIFSQDIICIFYGGALMIKHRILKLTVVLAGAVCICFWLVLDPNDVEVDEDEVPKEAKKETANVCIKHSNSSSNC